MKIKADQKGSTLIELVMVMTLLALFGVTIYTLIYSGANTQEKIMKEKDAQMNARIALSYINVRLRQNDSTGKINTEKIDLTGEDAIVIKERNFDAEYDTWIYCLNGKLMECLVEPDALPTEDISYTIVDIEGLETEINDDGSIKNTVYFKGGDDLESISSTVYMRSN